MRQFGFAIALVVSGMYACANFSQTSPSADHTPDASTPPTGNDSGEGPADSTTPPPVVDSDGGTGPTVFASGLQQPLGLLADGDFLFVADASGIRRIQISDPTGPWQTLSGTPNVRYMTFDDDKEYIYFTVPDGVHALAYDSAQHVAALETPLAGVPASQKYQGIGDYFGIAFSSGQLYVSTYHPQAKKILKVQITAGTGVGTHAEIGNPIDGVEGLALVGGTLFGAKDTGTGTPGLYEFDPDTGAQMAMLTAFEPAQIAVADQTLYVAYQDFTTAIDPAIATVKLDGTRTVLAHGAALQPGVKQPAPTGIAVTATMVFWCDSPSGTIMKMPR